MLLFSLFFFSSSVSRLHSQVSWVLDQRDPVAGGADDLTAVRNHTDQMLCLLAEERPAGGDSDPPGTI